MHAPSPPSRSSARQAVRPAFRDLAAGPGRRAAALLLLLALAAGLTPAAAQDLERVVEGPAADWRTVRTEHFRVHYPRHSETWARAAAARMEAIRERVAAEVGFAPEVVLDVVVSDPVAAANGFVLPILGWPRMVLWTSPPAADSVIGHYRDWAELLVIHEDVHVVHLLRPSRNPWRRALSSLLPLGPVAGAPRWVSEGYATVLEGRLSGAGRPASDLRAAILRRWAQEGKLPSYGRLASDEGSYLGMSMAYLAGSAYLEWLEERTGEGSLRDLWARLTARQPRDFEAAFRGVFGDSPRDLWDRFTAELTWRALELERRVAGTAVPPAGRAPAAADPAEADLGSGWIEGEPWLDLDGQTGAPAVSPDGSRLAVVVRHRDDPPELVVVSTAVDEEAVAKREKRLREMLQRDPEDVAPVPAGPPPHRRLHTLPTLDGAPPSQPRWLPGSEALLLVRFLPDRDGFLHPDLFRWTPETGDLERLTRGAGLRDPDPAPDGSWAVAVRNRHGFSQLVRVELAGPDTGRVTPLTEETIEVVYDSPRLSPDGRRMAYARHARGAWGLVVREVLAAADGASDRSVEGEGRTGATGGGASMGLGPEREVSLPPAATVASPVWGVGSDGRPAELFAVVGSAGFIDVFVFREEGGDGVAASGAAASGLGGAAGWRPDRVTRTRGGAFAPVVGPLPPAAPETSAAEPASPAEALPKPPVPTHSAAEPSPSPEDAGTIATAGSAAPPGTGPASRALYFLALEPDGLDVRRLILDGGEPGAPTGAGQGVAVASTPEAVPPGAAAVPPDGGPAAVPFAPPAAVAGLEPVVRPPDRPVPPPFAAAELPPAEPYGLGPRQELLVLTGGALGAAGGSTEVGVRSGDLLGRLELLAFAALGADAGAEGGALAAEWRRLPVDLSLHLFAAEERPSRQDPAELGPDPGRPLGQPAGPSGQPFPVAGLLDVKRRGAELAADWEGRIVGGPLAVAGGLYAGTAEPAASSTFLAPRELDERSAFVAAHWNPATSRGRARLGLGLGGRFDVGETSSDAWNRIRGRVSLRAGWDEHAVSFAWERGEASGRAVEAVPVVDVLGRGPGESGLDEVGAVSGPLPAASTVPALDRVNVLAPWQLFQVGGLPSSLLPSSVAAARLPVPALPAAALVGESVEAQRVDLAAGFLPLPLFAARYRVELGGVESDWRTLAGAEWRGGLGPVPLLRLPELRFTVGAARLLDGPRDGDWEGWLALTWNP